MSLAVAIPDVREWVPTRVTTAAENARAYVWTRFDVKSNDFASLLEWIGQDQGRTKRSVQYKLSMNRVWSRWMDASGRKMAQCGTHAVIQLVESVNEPMWAFLVGEGKQIWRVYVNNRYFGQVVDGYFIPQN
ncbi:MAG TPA: hypothetical protein VH593_08325 [Ktedonobacteraceae bacterium]|jgi:hypothetical protein